MNNISSDTLFHFTTWDNLVSILENGFYPSYSSEYISIFSKNPKVRIPMVSLCDIPLSQISTHVERYGCYGIGLTKQWGMREGLNPVMYIGENSDLYGYLANSLYVAKAFKYIMPMVREELEAITEILKNPPSELDDLLKTKKRQENLDDYLINMEASTDALFGIIMYLKEYEGISSRTLDQGKSIRFYDEREWRYVPMIEKDGIYSTYISEEDFKDELKMLATLGLKNRKLPFEPSDIKYIIVKDDNEILETIRTLENIKGDKYPANVIKVLTTRITTYQQIREVF